MKVFLMYKDHDFDLQRKLPPNEHALTQDLELDTLFNAMALDDKFLFEVAKKTFFSGLDNDLDAILYRQNILKDCLKNSTIVRDVYDIVVELHERKKKDYYWIFRDRPSTILHSSIKMMQMFMGMLKKLKNIADEHADKFESAGFTSFFAMLNKELGDEYFVSIQNHLKELEFRNGVLISAELGESNKGTNYILRKSQDQKQSWIKRIFAKKPNAYTFYIAERDEGGARALLELKDRGINLVANALAQSTDHILSFFNMLRTELAFYVGCLNLHGRLAQKGAPICFPLPVAPGGRKHSFKGLYDVCLALILEQRIVGTDVDADNKDLIIITGANQGGKSTFLRSIGLSHLMMQCGMFVPAEFFSSNVCNGIFTHFKREEDPTMKSGKLDEELSRMSEIVSNISSNPMMLFNESFAATNEREGSEIAKQITGALLGKCIKVFYVTHLYEFARGFYDKKMGNAIFLRAERHADGERTFKIIEGEPLQTSHGVDLYNRIFGTDN
jgi:DNA mismatch repair ATPase MutS